MDGTYSRNLAYSEPVPSGVLAVIMNGNELIKLPGPWQATWQAPAEAGHISTP